MRTALPTLLLVVYSGPDRIFVERGGAVAGAVAGARHAAATSAGRHARQAGIAGGAAVGRDRPVRRHGPVEVARCRGRAGQVAGRRRRDGVGGQQRLPVHSADKFGDVQLHVEWATPAAGQRQRTGSRQQRRVSDGPVRSAGARLLRQRHLCRRPGRAPSMVSTRRWSTPACRRASGRATTSCFAARDFDADGTVARAGADHRVSQRGPGAGQRGDLGTDGLAAARALQARTPTSCRSRCKTTATRCATATSGCANWPNARRAGRTGRAAADPWSSFRPTS